jgi:uncharacterized Zn finger protein
VHYILGEQFDEDPFLLFRLRGRSQEQILEALRARRAAAGGFDEDGDEADEVVIPLAETIDSFWKLGHPLTQFKTNVKPPVTELPLLKRLGQPNFMADDVFKLLGPAYKAITEAAIETAFSEEPEGAVED